MIDSDAVAWSTFPHHRRWFNKLDFALRMGYTCAPSGVPPSATGTYIVRPIYNLLGMGAGARLVEIEAGDDSAVPPGFFWCEIFTGRHLSITYEWIDSWKQLSCWEGFNSPMDLSRFTLWRRVSERLDPPPICNELSDVGVINIEFIDGKPIEVHLRSSPDPDDADEMIPVWGDQEHPPNLIPWFDDAGGYISVPRHGFIIKNHHK